MTSVNFGTGDESSTVNIKKNLLCPECSREGKSIKTETLNNMLNDDIKDKIKENDYCACINSDCNVSYFNGKNIFLINDTRVKIWYKDDGPDVPICYCSKIYRGEITEAVEKNYDTIEKIREYTGKNITGKCTTENPLGICCHKEFKNIKMGEGIKDEDFFKNELCP